MISMHKVRAIATGLDHPEGVALGADGMLVAGGEAGQIYRVDPTSGHVDQIAQVDGGFILGVCADAAGSIYACDAGNAAVWRISPDGTLDRWCDSVAGGPLVCPNWLAFDEKGLLVVSDSGREDPSVAEGRLLRLPAGGGEAEVLGIRPLVFANGFAIHPDGTIAVHESFAHRLVAVQPSGDVVEIAHFGTAVPDGVAITADGGYVVSMYYPYQVFRIRPGGSPELLLDDALGTMFPMPTNICFFGDGLESLAIASLGGHGLAAVEPGVAGAPLLPPSA